MKIKVKNENLYGLHAGFHFSKGIANVPEGKEEDAKRIAGHLGYEIIEDKPEPKPKATRKEPAKKTTTKKVEE